MHGESWELTLTTTLKTHIRVNKNLLHTEISIFLHLPIKVSQQMSYDITYMWNLKKIQMNLFIKQKQTHRHRKQAYGGRSQDGGGIGRVITFSSTNSLKKQQNGEQSLQNNF